MTRSKKRALAGAASITAMIALWTVSGSAQTLVAGPFNADQVEAGRTAYIANCQVCHGDTLSGFDEAPPIAGRGFMISWANKTTDQLYNTLQAEMPFTAPGSLDATTYTNLVAFLLHANGARTGTTTLTPTTAVKINTVANGTLAPDVADGVKPSQTAQ